MSYVTREALLLATAGLPLTLIPEAELDQICQDASDLIDSIAPQHFGYREIGTDDPAYPAEMRPYDPETETLTFRERPVRQIYSLIVQDAVYAGERIGVTVDPSEIDINRRMGSAVIYSIRLSFTGGDVSRILRYSYRPQFVISYSAGYDDGTVQADGLSIPYPSWLTTATRITALDQAAIWLGNALHGLGGFSRVVAGPFTYERPPTTPEGVPVAAARLIRANARRVYVGSTVA